jgi:hypothetical protein
VKKIIKKLVLGNQPNHQKPQENTIAKRLRNIKAIWNNDHHDDIGIEKIVRLFLASSQFLFPGIYIKQLFGKKSTVYQDLSVDGIVIIKILFPLVLLYFQLFNSNILFLIMVWFLLETMLYVPTLIFASDLFSKPRSYRRSMLLLFLNYLEMILSFAVIYKRGNYFNQPFSHWYDSIYFSLVTAASIGYGDIYPITPTGKFFVSIQSILYLTFVVMFLNFYSNRVETKGYFDHNNKS